MGPEIQSNWEGKHFMMLFFILLSRNIHDVNFNDNALTDFLSMKIHVHCKNQI